MAEKYIAFYGTILLQLNSTISDELYKLWNEGEAINEHYYPPYYDRVLKIQKSLEDVLKQTAEVSNIQWVEDLRKEHSDPFDDYLHPENQYLMQLSTPISFDVFLPVSKRQYQLPILYRKTVIQKFSVIYNGTVFLAYAPVEEDIDESNMLGPEIREILLQILSCASWEPCIIAPCPLRFEFFIQSNKEFLNSESELKLLNEVVEDIRFNSIDQVPEIFLYLFYQNSFSVELFSSLMSLKNKAEQLIWKIESSYDNIKEYYSGLNAKRIHGSKKKNVLREKIFQLHTLLYNYDCHIYKFSLQKTDFFDLIKEGETSENLKCYFNEEVKILEYPQSNILNSIEYIEDRISENRTNFYTMLAALVGAIAGLIGAQIPDVLKWIVSLFNIHT